ncbi:hypothetical protein KC221_25055, partial [Mycobacterium tuberculosis]|nr:hypothetical protein [Mycobacterium tuberculosis]
YLRADNSLQNYDEFAGLQALQTLDINDAEAVETFKQTYYLTDDDIQTMQSIEIPSARLIQDYRSSYNDIRDWIRRQKDADNQNKATID